VDFFKTMNIALRVFASWGLVITLATPLCAHTFTYLNGHTVDAEFVALAGNQVTLDISGKPVVVLLGLFSAVDQKFIRDSATAGSNPSNPAALATDKYVMPANRRSIHEWVTGDGVQDDASGVAKAFTAARNRAFTLVIDCPVRIHIGMDISRPVFIDNDTSVEFTEHGLFLVDNVMVPAFVIANSSSIRLLNWNIEYVGGLPIDDRALLGYYDQGVFIKKDGYAQPAFAFNGVVAQWLTKNRGLQFSRGATAQWHGPSNLTAIFYMIGSSSDVIFNHFRMFVPKSSGGHQFIPMAFTALVEFNSNQVVTREKPLNAANASVPSNIRFDDIELDGYYFGWQGTFHGATFHNIRAYRYGDLQDENGGNSGGVGKWFAPPHLFYLNDNDAACVFRNENIHISDVIDHGLRVGVARDRDPNHTSGYANSLKFGGVNSFIDHYRSDRPDGLADILNCNNVIISDVEATYDSSFLNDIFPGIRFPGPAANIGLPGKSIVNLTIRNLTLVDKAAVTRKRPVYNSTTPLNKNITLENVKVELHKWAGDGKIDPTFRGENNHIDIKYIILPKI